MDRCHGVFLRPGGGEESFDGVPEEGFDGGDHFTLRNGRIVQGRQPIAPDGAITYASGRIVREQGDHPRPGRYCHAVYIRGCDGFQPRCHEQAGELHGARVGGSLGSIAE